MSYSKGQLSSIWQNVIREGLGMAVDQGYCSEGMRFLHQRDAVPTSMEVHINLSLRAARPRTWRSPIPSCSSVSVCSTLSKRFSAAATMSAWAP